MHSFGRSLLVSVGVLVTLAVVAACAYVEKTTPDDAIMAGDNAVFEIEVGADLEAPPTGFVVGPDEEGDVTLTDDLPDGQVWAITGDVGTEEEPQCEVDTGTLAASSGILTCTYFFPALVETGPAQVTLTAITDESDCGVISNTSNVSVDTDGPTQPDSSTATITVSCPSASAMPSVPPPSMSVAPTPSATEAPTPTPPSGGGLPDTAGGAPIDAAVLLVSAVVLGGWITGLAVRTQRVRR